MAYRIIRPNGDVRFVRSVGQAIRNDRGEPVRLIGATQDVTEQVQARELLCRSEERLKNAERLAHLGHWQWNLKNNQVIWSEECFRIFGQPRDYTPNYEDFFQAVVPEDRELLEREARQSIAENRGSSVEFRIVRPDGEMRTLRSVSEVLLDGEGQPAFVFGACQDITSHKQIEELLLDSEQQLRALAGSLLTAQEDERRRLSRELHDDVTQRLAFLSLELGKLSANAPDSSEDTQARVRSLQDQALQIAAEVRRLSHGLHPSFIEDFGLSVALEEFCREFGEARGIRVAFDGFVEDAQLDRGGAACLYRVAQESLRNSVVHGHATEIHVQLTVHQGSVHMNIGDNGTGFSPDDARTKTGLGLIRMRERLRLARGNLSISSQPGQGTEITASVPLAGV